MPHREKIKKNRKFFPCLVIVCLIILLTIESYLIIDNPKNLFDFTSNQILKKKILPEQTKKNKKLTTSADQLENFAQEVLPSSELSKQIDQDLQNDNFIGTALIVQDGNILLQKGYGYSDAQNKSLNNYHSIYQIGSIQKGMTATLIAKQIQAGKLSLEDTVNHFYASIPMSSKITIQQLLSMTSGLKQGRKPTVKMSDEDFISFAISNTTMETYGKYNYDAVNYYLLVGILEQLTGEKYKKLFFTSYVNSLSLANTMFYDEFILDSHRTYAYEKKDKKNYATLIQDTPLYFDQEVGTGSIGMTVGDLYWYYSSWLNEKLISSDTFNRIWIPAGNGSYIGGIYNYATYFRGHGVEKGFEGVVYLSKSSKNAVILLTNQSPKNLSYQDLGSTIFKLFNTI